MANLHPTQQQTVSPHPASSYISKVKKLAVCIMLVFAVQMVAIPSQPSYGEGCVASATQSVITAGVVGAGLVLLDFAFTGGFFTALALANAGAATVGAGTAAGLLIAKGAAVAGTYGCVNASLWDKSSTPSPSPSR